MSAAEPGSASRGGRLVAGARRFVRVLLVDPIARGRLRDTGWPVGLRPVVAVGVAAFALAVVVILAAPVLRAWLPLSVSVGAGVLSLPRELLVTILGLVLVAVSFAQAAALHTRPRVTAVITVMTALIVLLFGSLDLEGAPVSVGSLVAVLAVVALVLLVALRRRRAFAWWEPPLVLAIVGTAAAVALGRSAAASAPFGIDFGPTATSLVLSSIGLLAVPAAIAAGAAVAEFAVTGALAVVAAVRRPRGLARDAAEAGIGAAPARRRAPWALLVVFGVVLLWRMLELALAALGAGGDLDLGAVPPALGILVAIAGLWLLIERVRREGRATVDDVLGRLDAVGLPVAIALSITLAPVVVVLLVAQILLAWGLDPAATSGAVAFAGALRAAPVLIAVRAAVGVVLVAVAIVLARRGRLGSPELLAAIGVVALASAASLALPGVPAWSSDALAALVALVTAALALVLAARRSLDAHRLALLTVALLLSAAAAWREVLADPLSLVVGASGIALVLFGFVWSFVTDADATHGDSPAYPTPSRVLLFLANAVFGVAVLAFGALARDVSAGIDLDAFARTGDELLGTALILAAVLATWAGVRERSAGSRRSAPTVGA